MKKIDLAVSLDSPKPIELLQALSKIKPFNQKPPSRITATTYKDGFKKFEGTSDWIDRWIPKCEFGVSAYWGYGFDDEYEEGFINFKPEDEQISDIVKFQIYNYELDPKLVLEILAPLPWTLAEFAYVYSEWEDYYGRTFGGSHFDHGWACAFKGEGHNRLVSRRWLEHGPWRLLRDEENDVSLIQFHDLEADSATALEQAKIGHEMIGPSKTGGFISINYDWENDVKGLYTLEERKLEIVVIDREVTHKEMRDYYAGRYYQVLGEDKPLERIAYVFLIEEEGRPYLHDLWLRELECWVINSLGVKRRIDNDYHPVPNKPDWVRRLEESEAS